MILYSTFSFGRSASSYKIPLWVEVIHCVENMKLNPDKFGTNGSFGQAYGLANFFFAAGVVVGFVNQQAGRGATVLAFGAALGP
jgi:hypothetical protein